MFRLRDIYLPEKDSMSRKKAVMYGAGNIGRGFIGPVFVQSGYEVTFIDVAEETVRALQREGRYPVRVLSDDGFEDTWIEGVKALDGRDTEKASDCIAEADILATAVGVRALPFVAPLIAAGLKKRFKASGAPLNIIICENLINANRELAALIKKELSGEDIPLFEKKVGLVEASIGRMVPVQTKEMQDGNPLRVCVEAYRFLPVDGSAFVGDPPALAGMAAFGDFDFYIQRKLFVHNMGHAICAYLGIRYGDRYIYEAAARPGVLFIAQNAMLESARALAAAFNMPLADLADHIQDLLCRFSNRALMDTCARVGGDTERKLGASDRFIGAIRCCGGQNIFPAFISVGAAAALYHHIRENSLPETEETAAEVLEKISGLQKDSPETARILSFYPMIKRGAETAELCRAALKAGIREDVI
jgi:mannitol-1-phosphate 5-dehydrogenase